MGPITSAATSSTHSNLTRWIDPCYTDAPDYLITPKSHFSFFNLQSLGGGNWPARPQEGRSGKARLLNPGHCWLSESSKAVLGSNSLECLSENFCFLREYLTSELTILHLSSLLRISSYYCGSRLTIIGFTLPL